MMMVSKMGQDRQTAADRVSGPLPAKRQQKEVRVKVRIMHRLIQEVPTELWTQKLEMEHLYSRGSRPLPQT